jgi:multidrug efflux pump
MNISEPFIRKPVATTLLVAAITLGGATAYRMLPVSPLPEVEFPTISVSASLPGASPETMASSVATPLERQFGRIAAITDDDFIELSRIDQRHAAIQSGSGH